MDLMNLLKERFSARSFEPKPVSQEMQEQILAAGLAAPTARNCQPVRFYVAGADQSEAIMSKCTRANFHAPLNILITVRPDEAWVRTADGWSAAEVDSAIIGTQMMYMAESLGLGTCWICAFSPEETKKAFAIGEGERPVSILSIGHKSAECKPGPMHASRRAAQELVTYCK